MRWYSTVLRWRRNQLLPLSMRTSMIAILCRSVNPSTHPANQPLIHPSGQPTAHPRIHFRYLYPEQISAEVLRRLLKEAATAGGQTFTQTSALGTVLGPKPRRHFGVHTFAFKLMTFAQIETQQVLPKRVRSCPSPQVGRIVSHLGAL